MKAHEGGKPKMLIPAEPLPQTILEPINTDHPSDARFCRHIPKPCISIYTGTVGDPRLMGKDLVLPVAASSGGGYSRDGRFEA